MQPFSFDFGERWFPFGPWRLAFRIYTDRNVYTPAPGRIRAKTRDGVTTLRADAFAWAGLQRSASGRFEAEVARVGNELRWSVRAEMPERIKGSSTYVRGIGRGEVAGPDFAYGELAEGKRDLLQYPGYLRLPVWFLRQAGGRTVFALSDDIEVRGKTFAVQCGARPPVLELHHHEDARRWGPRHESPA
jgi:hypothetical protein